ncbi:MAG: EF-hand domain-containing protein [Oricola sp.]
MKTNSKIALLVAGVALTMAGVATAYADNGPRGQMPRDGSGFHHGRDMQGGNMGPGNMGPGNMGRGNMGVGGDGPAFGQMFQRADKDNSGTITPEEFTAASPFAIASADANSDGKVNVDELTDSMMREMMKRRAERMIERFDTDNDGQISLAEIENSQKKMFDSIDIDGSGAIEQDELSQQRGVRDGGRGMGDGQGFHHRQGGFGRN